MLRLRMLLVGSACVVALAGCSDTDQSSSPDDGKYGSLLNFQEFDVAPDALPVEALAEPPVPPVLPRRAGLTNLPAVAMQGTPSALGSPGTCEAQAFGYGLGSYTAARLPDGTVKWDASLAENEPSAAYQFALAEEKGFATCPAGGQATQYLSRLIAFGSPSTADVPYEPSCEYFASIDLVKSYPDEPRLRIGSFATFQIQENSPLYPPGSVLDRIKTYVASGQAVAFSGRVLENYGPAPVLTDGVIYETAIIPGSGHAQLIVGYDDDIGSPEAPGALLVQNSFGTNWPPASAGFSPAPPGLAYWSYNTFLTTQIFAGVAYPRDPSPPSGTPLSSASPGAPVAAITRAFQWAPAGWGVVYLIFVHQFADPVLIATINVSEPSPGSSTATATYGQFLDTGYTFLARTDGKEFLPGSYGLSFLAETVGGVPVTYRGLVQVGTAQPTTPPSASMAEASTILDSIGQQVLLSGTP